MNSFKKQSVRLVSVFLSVLMLTALFVAPISVNAESKKYYYKISANESAIFTYDFEEAWFCATDYDGGVAGILTDVTLSTNLATVEGNEINIELNGHKLDRGLTSAISPSLTSDGNVITVSQGSTLNVYGGTKAEPKPSCTNTLSVWEGAAGKIASYSVSNRGVITGGGRSDFGGGIVAMKNAEVNLYHTEISGNRADQGGGIALCGQGASLYMERSYITHNRAEVRGGGICVTAKNTEIVLNDNSGVMYNVAKGYGGGVSISDTGCNFMSDSYDYNCEVSHNYAGKDGGGFYLGAQASITGTINITGNTANGSGGGVFAGTDRCIIANCVISDNQAVTGDGGGVVFARKSDKNALSDVTVKGNNAEGKGDGVYVAPGINILLKGITIIDDNGTKGSGQNLFLGTSSTSPRENAYVIDMLKSGSAVGVTYGKQHESYLTLAGCGKDASSFYFERYDGSNSYNYHFTYLNSDKVIELVSGAAPKPQAASVITAKLTATSNKYNSQTVYKGVYQYCPDGGEGDQEAAFYYSDGYFMDDPKNYNTHLATLSACMAVSAFNAYNGDSNDDYAEYRDKSNNIRQMMSDMGVKDEDIFVNDNFLKRPEKHTIGCCIGRKTLSDGKTLVIIAVRGGGYEAEWAGNVTLGSSGEHKGFATAAEQVFSALQDYLAERDINGSSSNTKFWIAGYSRAGATSNLTAKRIVDAYDNSGSRTFAYPIEAPKGGVESAKKSGSNYNCIHNVVNYMDIVPWVAMGELGFIRYGVDHFVPGNSTKNDYNEGVPADNYTLILNSSAYNSQKEKMLTQLKTLSEKAAEQYDSSFRTCTMEYANYVKKMAKEKAKENKGIVSLIVGLYTGPGTALSTYIGLSLYDPGEAEIDGDLIKKDSKNTPAEKWIPEFFEKFVRYAVDYDGTNAAAARSKYSDDKVSDTNKTFEDALADILAVLKGGASKSGQLKDGLAGIAEVGMLDLVEVALTIYLSYMNKDIPVISYFGNDSYENIFNNDLWPMIRDKMKEKGIPSDEVSNYRNAFKAALRYLLRFVGDDYNKDDGQLLGTLAKNVGNLTRNHIPEIAKAWIRSYDSYYNNETRPVTYNGKTSPADPAVEVTSDYTGATKTYTDPMIIVHPGDTIRLVPESKSLRDSGEAIYYQFYSKDDKSEQQWRPFSIGKKMSELVASTGTLDSDRYVIRTFSTHYDLKSNDETTDNNKQSADYLQSESKEFVLKYEKQFTDGNTDPDIVFEYNDAKGYYVLKKYKKADEKVVIPSTIQDIPVGAIGDRAFSGQSEIKSITLPDSIESIGDYAFINCSGITKFTVPESLQHLGKGAFINCPITELTMGDNVFEYGNLPVNTIEKATLTGTLVGNNAFKDCVNLKSVTLSDNLTTIGNYAFANCHSLKSINITDKVTTIGDYAFSGCSDLEPFALPFNLKFLGNYAFEGCVKFTDITVPHFVYSIGNYAFKDCSGLENVTIQDYIPTGKTAHIGSNVFAGCGEIENLTIPGDYVSIDYGSIPNYFKNVTVTGYSVADGRFSNCSFKNLTFANTVESIGNNAFKGCTELKSVGIPAGVGSIGNNAFEGCTGLTEATVLRYNAAFGTNVFKNCPVLTIYAYPNSSANTYAVNNNIPFSKHYNQTFVYHDNGYTFTVYNGNAVITKYTLGETSLTIPTKLLGYDVTQIAEKAFDGDNYGNWTIENITIPEGITYISNEAFKNCVNLKSVTLPSTLKQIDHDAFYGCKKLENVTIGSDSNSALTIKERAFGNCTSLKSMVLPRRVKLLKENVFEGDTSLSQISILGKGTTFSSDTFNTLKEFTVFGYSGTNAYLYAKDFKKDFVAIDNFTYSCRLIGGNYVASITGCSDSASTDAVTPPYCLNSADSTDMKTYKVTSIAADGFKSASVVPNLSISSNVTSIGNNAFKQSGIKSITIPESVSSIGTSAFTGCTNLTSVTILNKNISIGSGSFAGCGSNLVILSYNHSTAHTYATNNSLRFVSIDNVNTTSDWVYETTGSTSATITGYTGTGGSVTVPDTLGGRTVESIKSAALQSASTITSVTIPSSVKTIGDNAFKNCSNLKAVTILNSSAVISASAFDNSSSLTIFGYKVSTAKTYTDTKSIGFMAVDETNGFNFTLDRPNSGEARIDGYDGSVSATLIIPPVYVKDGNVFTVTKINDFAFVNESTLENVVIPDTVTAIGSRVFYNCGLTSVTIPNSVTTIGENAFENCGELTSVTIPASVIKINASPFHDCDSLTEINVDSNNQCYKSVGGVLFDKAGTKLIEYPAAKSGSTYTVANSVTSIEAYAFAGNQNLTGVTIGNGVKKIPDGTFENCESLASVTVNGSVTEIGKSAFNNCSALTSFTIPSTVTSIGNFAFEGSGINSVTVPSSVTDMGAGVFRECKNLTTATFQNGVTAIGESAFSHCTSLESVTIPDSVTTIGDSAFFYCKALKGVAIHTGVTSIEDFAFGYSGLTSISIPNGVTRIADYTFKDCADLTQVTIPNSVSEIGADAFRNCSALTTVSIPGSVTSIGDEAFMNTGLTSVTIPDSVSVIGEYAFSECADLASITFNYGLSEIGKFAFGECGSLTSVNLPGSVSSIGEFAFYECTGVTSLTIPEGVDTIGEYAFYRCTGLTSVTIPESVTQIEGFAFSRCSNLGSVTFLNGETKLADDVFAIRKGGGIGAGLTLYAEPSSNIQEYAEENGINFLSTSGGFEYVLDDDDNAVITKYKGSGSVVVPSTLDGYSVTAIAQEAFRNQKSITSITVSEGITAIYSGAFTGCKKLSSISLPASLTTITNQGIDIDGLYFAVELNPFDGCSKLKSITVASGNQNYKSVDGVLYNKEGTELIKYPASKEKTSFTVPSTVTAIKDYAFWNASDLEIVNLSNVTSISEHAFENCANITNLDLSKVTEFGEAAFSGCSGLKSAKVSHTSSKMFFGCKNLESIEIKSGITSIEADAFNGCESLETIEIANTVTSIGNGAFAGTGIKSITIPDSVENLGWWTYGDSGVFSGCRQLTSVTLPNNPEYYRILPGMFRDCTKLKSVTIPQYVTQICDNAFAGCTGLESITIPDNVGGFGKSVFSGCTSLKNVTLPNGEVWDVDDEMFSGCTSLRSITIPAGFEKIGLRMFENCTNLKNVTIKNGVTTIMDYAFAGCESLESILLPESVEYIYDGAFSDCENLTEVYILNKNVDTGYYAESPFEDSSDLTIYSYTDSTARNYTDGKKINFSAIDADTGLTYTAQGSGYAVTGYTGTDTKFFIPPSVVIEGTQYAVNSIGTYAFKDRTDIENVVILDGITNIGSGAFKGCSSLWSVSIPASVTTIGSNAFNGCESLESITIPAGVTSIDASAFNNCSSLTSIEVSPSNPNYMSIDGNLYSKDGTLLVKLAPGKSVKTFEIPSSVTRIGANAFGSCGSLTSLTIPDSVTQIDANAFSGCDKLTDLTVPGNMSFNYARLPKSSVKTLTVTGTSVKTSAFENWSKLKSVKLSDTITSVDALAFVNCMSLNSITIPDSVTSIGDYAFIGCVALKDITIPNSVTSIGEDAFDGCDNLVRLTVSGNSDFNYDNLPKSTVTGITVTASPEAQNSELVKEQAFSGCTNLKSVNIKNGVETIEAEAFKDCAELEKVSLPHSVTNIEDRAFEGCTKLSGFSIPDSTTTIGSNAFKDSSSLESIIIPDSVTTIGADAFSGCTGLTELVVRGDGEFSYGNLPKSSVTDLTVTGTTVKSNAFNGFTDLENITFDDEVESISDSAFSDCTSLKTVVLPSNLTEVSDNLFQSCTALETVEFPDGVTEIGNNSFKGCSSLTGLDLPLTLTSIGDYAFSGASSLGEVFIPDSVTHIGTGAFDNLSDSNTIAFYAGSDAEAYCRENNITNTTAYEKLVGDVNGDGVVDICDVTLIQKYKVGIIEKLTYRGAALADTNGDESITIRDATLIQMFIVGMVTELG